RSPPNPKQNSPASFSIIERRKEEAKKRFEFSRYRDPEKQPKEQRCRGCGWKQLCRWGSSAGCSVSWVTHSITFTKPSMAGQSTSVTTCGMSPWNEGIRKLSRICLLLRIRSSMHESLMLRSIIFMMS
ncbi:unnamed protein product, partial [Linum tenue]